MTRRCSGRRLFAFGLSFLFLVVVAGCGGTGERGSGRSTGREHVRAPSLAGVALPLSDAYDLDRVLDTLPTLRVAWVRVGFAGLDAGGKVDFTYFDSVVDRVRRRGIAVLGLLGGAEATCERPDAAQVSWSCPPAPGREKDYADYLYALVAHFAGRVTAWESWNEPDNQEYWVTGPDPADYARVLRVQHRAVKRADPSARLLLAATGPTNLPWTAALLSALGGDRPFDAVALHPYRFDAGPLDGHPFVLADGSSEALDMRSELLSSARLFATDAAVHGGRGELPEVWITELGWGAASEAGGELASGVPLPSYAAQARYYRELVTLLWDDRDLGFVHALFWWNLIDDITLTGSEEGFRYYGLLHEDFSPKPVARAFSALASRRR